MYLVTSVKICTMMIEVSSEQSRSQFYMHKESAAAAAVCCYTAVIAAATVLLLPDTLRHRVPDRQICCWFIESDPSVVFLFIQTRFTSDVPLGSTVAFTTSICLPVLHAR